jgi:hypothetical protein
MARLTKEQWKDAQAKWESNAGLSYESLGLDASKQAIGAYAKRHNWTRNNVVNVYLNIDDNVVHVDDNIGKEIITKEVKKELVKNPVGRPTLYKPEYDDQAYRFCLMGATDLELAEFFDVNVDTINEWKKVHPNFSVSIREGKENADSNVVESLYKSAIGYHFLTEDKVIGSGESQEVITLKKQLPPEVTAQRYWLNNRQRDKWKDRVDAQVEVSVDKNTLALIESQFITRMAEAVSRQSAIYSERNIIDVTPE